MTRFVAPFHRWQEWLVLFVLVGVPRAACAHERFINHMPKGPLHEDFFRRLDPNMLNIGLRVAGLMSLMLFIWFLRQHPLNDFFEYRLLANLRGKPKEWVDGLSSYVTDRPVQNTSFVALGEWAVVFFIRCPALLLMFAASNDVLLVPSYPLEPSTAKLFVILQVVVGIAIVTQMLLPLLGGVIIGIFLYMITAFDWKIAVDIVPVLPVAAVYQLLPWNSLRVLITSLDARQTRRVRLFLGFGFFALGWMKIYNYYLSVGVVDDYPSLYNDPLIKMFFVGTNPFYKRECWVMAFSLCEVMTGFLIMVGVFSRIWCVMMAYLFTKLLVIDFGWSEIPHLYPITAFVVLACSNSLTNGFQWMDERAEMLARKGRLGWWYFSYSFCLAIIIAFLAIFPMLWFLTKIPHPKYF